MCSHHQCWARALKVCFPEECPPVNPVSLPKDLLLQLQWYNDSLVIAALAVNIVIDHCKVNTLLASTGN